MQRTRPSRAELRAAAGKSVPDVIAPGLKVLFCGINPSLYSGAVGHHFARPGNRFWPVLYMAGFTPRLLLPEEERELLRYGYGITNLAERATSGEHDLSVEELVAGRTRLEEKAAQYVPDCIAVLGIGAYRAAFARRQAELGVQPETLGGAALWVLPNPSGLNAHYQAADLARLFRALRDGCDGPASRTDRAEG